MSSVVSLQPAVSMKRNRMPSSVSVFLQGIAGRSRSVGNDGPVFAQERVEQGGFAPVWRPEDGHGHPFSNGASRGEAVSNWAMRSSKR